ncbi:hydroxyacid dehydrogenase [Staphylococcus pseudoxylosus]|uniref:NAD(P)-dependent oxidoreductase n=1 Tax=Staphylococcus pseudoxylosus TaxID=2282419 RepID=UPI002DBE2678|nr:NAD(P)-dependent oxidoreductase [Staphylococcus pseudoxylosus]MEB6036555.1 hydroxyacid dehydrogenase [Staphylococcus pseudoxylosus]MEB7763509.1 hydroxyacid dehydrogenase [Staphylococcus pseudoxylosus]
MKKVFIEGAIPETGLNQLKKHFDVDMYTGETLISQELLIQKIQDADALITLLSTQVSRQVIESAPKLKIIANYGAGFNNIDIQAAREHHINVTNTPIASTNATAELTMGILLAVARRIPEGDQLCRNEGFNGWSPLFFRGREVSGKTIGIIGLGEIGTAVAKRAKGFDMNILYTGPKRYEDKEAELNAKYVTLDTLLERSDFVTLNCAYNEQLKHMIDYEAIQKMKPTSYLINASRGPIVYEAELVKALKEGVIEGAALDVFEFEPQITEELKSMKNVVITPHIGNATFEARDMMADIVATNVVKQLNDETPNYIVN